MHGYPSKNIHCRLYLMNYCIFQEELSNRNNILPSLSHEIERLYGELDRHKVSVFLQGFFFSFDVSYRMIWRNVESKGRERGGGGEKRKGGREREMKVD